jgi:hypothetical protein
MSTARLTWNAIICPPNIKSWRVVGFTYSMGAMFTFLTHGLRFVLDALLSVQPVIRCSFVVMANLLPERASRLSPCER